MRPQSPREMSHRRIVDKITSGLSDEQYEFKQRLHMENCIRAVGRQERLTEKEFIIVEAKRNLEAKHQRELNDEIKVVAHRFKRGFK